MSGTRASAELRYIPVEAALEIIAAYEAVGGDADKALAAAGLSHLKSADKGRSNIHVPRSAFIKLASKCVTSVHDIACRRRDTLQEPLIHVRLMCTAMLACPDLRSALKTACKFEALYSGTKERLSLAVEGEIATLRWDPGFLSQGDETLIVMVFSLACYHHLISWLIKEEIPLEGVSYVLSPPAHDSALCELLGIAPTFSAPFNEVRFQARYLHRPVMRSHNELDKLFAWFPFDLVIPEYEQEALGEKVRVTIMAALKRGQRVPDMKTLARMFGLSVPTFRRRIAEENTSLRLICNECRKDLAIELLENPNLSIKELAFQMQFASVPSFRHAFKSWTGMSPTAFRKDRMQLGNQ